MSPINVVLVGATILTLGIVSLNTTLITDIPVEIEVREAPLTILSARIVTPEVKLEGALEYVLVAQKNRSCRPQADLMFVSKNGDVKTAGREARAELPIKEEPGTIRRRVRLPKSVDIGEWEFLIVGHCQPPGEPWFWPIYHPTMKFEVVP